MVTFDSPLLREVIDTIEFPPFSGFLDCHCEKAYVVAGGMGLGAMVGLIDQRRRGDLPTVVQFHGSDVSRNEVYRAFPSLDHPHVELECWDTYRHGHDPNVEKDVANMVTKGHLVFFAGPRSLGNRIIGIAKDRIRVNG